MRRTVCALLLLAPLLLPGRATAQLSTGVGAGIAVPVGDFADSHDRGYTVRGQLGLSLVLASVHAQLGWSRFNVAEDVTEPAVGGFSVDEDANVYHAGVGGRLGLGLFFVGANAFYFFGDGDTEMGLLPEVGLSLLSLEVVADGRVTGDAKWVGLRAGIRF